MEERPGLTSRLGPCFTKVAAAIVVALSLSATVRADNLVLNGGFETGDFSDWTLVSEPTSIDFVECPGPGLVPEGNCDAYFGPVGTPDTLSQVLATIPGRLYRISFQFASDGGMPSAFSAAFGGPPLLLNLTDPGTTDYIRYSFNRVATSTATSLIFSFRDDPGFLRIDDIAVQAPEPATITLIGLGMVALLVHKPRRDRRFGGRTPA